MCAGMAVATVATASSLARTAPAIAAGAHPWCVVYQEMTGAWGCSYDTFEQCRAVARSGNTGFCAQNPGYQEPVRPARKVRKRKG